MNTIMIIIVVIIFSLCITVLFMWNESRKERAFLVKLLSQDKLNESTFNLQNKTPVRILSNYRGYNIALGVDFSKDSKQIIIELFLKTPTGVKMEIRDPKSLLFRKVKNTEGIWIGEYKESPAQLKLDYFDSLIDRIEVL